MTPDTVLALFSASKPMVATAGLQLVQQGRLALDTPVKNYVPEIDDLQVLLGFDASGPPQLRPPRRPVTVRMLFQHTAGFSYDFLNSNYRRLVKAHGYAPAMASNRACLRMPLLSDPGETWCYGLSTDWLGLVIEAVTGQLLQATLQAQIFDPLGMVSTGFVPTPSMSERLAVVHRRKGDELRSLPAPQGEPEVQMGGQGLYSTAEDYIRFIRAWLNDGRFAGGELFDAATAALAFAQPRPVLRPMKSCHHAVALDAEFFEGVPKSQGMIGMINDAPAPTGRAADSVGWAGLANVFFWVDRKRGLGGFWGAQVLPFFDPPALAGYLDFERTAYASFLGVEPQCRSL